MIPRILLCLLFVQASSSGAELPAPGLLLDLDAKRGVAVETGNRVAKWVSEVPGHRFEFLKRDEGRKELRSGRPTLREAVAEVGGAPALVFLQQELVCPDEDAFDLLITGKGHTWAAVAAVHPQRVGVPDVNLSQFCGSYTVWENADSGLILPG